MKNEINNLTSEQNILDNKFAACTSFSLDILRQLVSRKTLNEYNIKFDIKTFRQKLLPYKMSEYSEHLYLYMILECKKNVRQRETHPKSIYLTRRKLEAGEKLVSSLRALLSGGKLNCSIRTKTKSFQITQVQIKKILSETTITAFSDEIEALRLNWYPLSREEAIQAINRHSDVNWIKDWMVSMEFLDADYESFTLEGFDEFFNNLGISDKFGFKEKLLGNLIADFASEHGKSVPLNIKELESILNRIKEVKSKRGRKENTTGLKYLAFTLSTLIRLDRYLDDPKIETMNEIAIENPDLRFIHDVMAFFKLIVDHSRSSKSRQSLEPFIRKIINTLNDQATIDDAYLILRILKFDILKN